MKVDKSIIKLYRNETDETETPAVMTKAEALSFLWDLSEEVYSLSGKYDVKSRLQRHIVSITRT